MQTKMSLGTSAAVLLITFIYLAQISKRKIELFQGPDGLSVSGVDSFHFLTILQMNVDV